MYFEGSILGTALTPAAAHELGELIDKESVLRKFSVALAVRAGKQLDFGCAPRSERGCFDQASQCSRALQARVV
jgi:hypothetical protein